MGAEVLIATTLTKPLSNEKGPSLQCASLLVFYYCLTFALALLLTMYKAISKEVTVGTEAVLNGMDIPSTKMTWPGGNYLSMDLQNMQAKIGFVGETMKSGASSAGDNKTTVDAIKKGLAAAFTGTAAKSGSTWVTKVGEKTELKTKTAAACTDPTEATCISKHPTKCSASGALSTVATVGAAIAALAMSF